MDRRLRVLWVAFACAPGRTSEPGHGWRPIRDLASYVHSLAVLTDEHNRAHIENGPPLPRNVEIHYVPMPAPPLIRGEWAHRFSYFVWLLRAFLQAKQLHRERPFDLVHHVTYAMSWMPPLPGRLGVPFVWNAGNTLTAPLALLWTAGVRGLALEALRNVVVRAGWALSKSIVHADLITVGHTDAGGRLRPFFSPALDSEEIELFDHNGPSSGERFRVVSVGRLLPVKGLHLGLKAFALVAQPGWEYLIIGSGPQERTLRRLAARLGIAEKVCFTGWLPRNRVLEALGSADVFLFPSLHDSFGYAVLEAMAAGLPVVCLDCGGPSLVVDEAVGVKVAVGQPGQVVRDLAAALRYLAQHPDRRRQMGQAAREQIRRRHTWEVRVQEILALWEEALKRRARR
ncbi:MAG: glycosyltransferase [Bacteroidota bacterium]|nr:glycosyltransferase [Bacteroidota bacterium]